MTGRAAAALALTVALPLAARAADRWISVRTAHLLIVSNASDGAASRVAQRLERFIDALAPIVGPGEAAGPPVTVIAFRNDASFAPFQPSEQGRTMNVAGYFQRADDLDLIALSLETQPTGHPYRVIYHEYAHALAARSSVLWPLWLQEGIADFYSTFEADDRRAAVGQPILEHLRLLREQRWLPLDAILAAKRASSDDSEQSQSVFYAESWVLVHYLLAGDRFARRAAFMTFVEQVTAGVDPEAAFAAAFGGDRRALEADLRRYVVDGRCLGVNIQLDRPPSSASSRLRPISEAEAEVLQGSLLMRIGRAHDAEAHLTRAHALAPAAPRLDESLGFLALSRAQYDDAEAHLRQAVDADPANYLAPYYLAETLRRREMERGVPLAPETARAMMPPLRAAIALSPGFARAYYLLGYAQLVSGDDLAEGVRLLQTAIRLAPPNRAAMLTLASIQLKMRDYRAAAGTARAILDAPDTPASIKDEARVVADTAERVLKVLH